MKAYPETPTEKMFNILEAINDAYSRLLKGFILAEPKPNSAAWKLISALIANPNKELNLIEIFSGDIHAAYGDFGFQKGIIDLFLR